MTGSGCKNFIGKRKTFIFNEFVDLKPVETSENGSDICEDLGALTTARGRVLNLFEQVKLIVWKVVIVTVIEFRIDNGVGCFVVEIWVATGNLSRVIARFRKYSDLV